MINEMMLEPQQHASTHAMLNTLYPPTMEKTPTSRLTIANLTSQREGFFHYIKTVNKRGPNCLEGLMKQGAKGNEENGWSAVRRTLTNYINLAEIIIEDSQLISNVACCSTTPEISSEERLKYEASINFPETKHSKNSSTSSSKSTTSTTSTASIKSQGSTLERLAREIKRMRPRRVTAHELIDTRVDRMDSRVEVMPTTPENIDSGNTTPTSAKSDKANFLQNLPPTPMTPGFSSGRMRLGLRKMKSFGAIAELKHSNLSSSSLRDASAPAFDAEEMKRKRIAFERRQTNAVAVV